MSTITATGEMLALSEDAFLTDDSTWIQSDCIQEVNTLDLPGAAMSGYRSCIVPDSLHLLRLLILFSCHSLLKQTWNQHVVCVASINHIHIFLKLTLNITWGKSICKNVFQPFLVAAGFNFVGLRLRLSSSVDSVFLCETVTWNMTSHIEFLKNIFNLIFFASTD